jgi:hypothetical protein
VKNIKHPLQIGQHKDVQWANQIDEKQNDIEKKVKVRMM